MGEDNMYLRFAIRSIDQITTMVQIKISDEFDMDICTIFMSMVEIIEMAQEYFGAELLTEPVPIENQDVELIFYTTFVFQDTMTKEQFEYCILESFLS